MLGRPFASETLVEALHLEQLRRVDAELVAGLGLARDSGARSRNGALRELCRAARTQLDPTVVDALCRVLARDLRHTKKRLDANSA